MLVTTPSHSFAVDSECAMDTHVTSLLLLSVYLDSLMAYAPSYSNRGLLIRVETVADTSLTLPPC